MMATKLGMPYRKEPIDYLIATHYKKHGRPFRFCHPRDLLLQVRNYCMYHNHPAGNDQRVFRPGGGELLRGDVIMLFIHDAICP